MFIDHRLGHTARQMRILPLEAKYQWLSIYGKQPTSAVEALPAPAAHRAWWCALGSISLFGQFEIRNRALRRWCLPGDWDIKYAQERPSARVKVAHDSFRSETHNSLQMMFVDHRDFRETPEYQTLSRRVREGLSAQGCRTEDDVTEHFRSLVNIFESMKTDGYRPHRDIIGRPSAQEIRVFVTRDGSLLHRRYGQHRIRIAELAKVETVAVNVRYIHPEWLLQQMISTGSSARAAALQGLQSIGLDPIVD